MKKLILFGDSNTYGYDPRGFLGGRYPAEIRWTTHVKEALKDNYDVIEEGMNGRQLPSIEYGYFTNLITDLSAEDIFVMMLGTNDILLTYNPNVELAVTKLDRILSYVKENCKAQFILIAPPYIKVMEPEMQRYHDCCIEMNQRFLELAKQYDITTFDASEWNIEMGYDGVHFSIDGHKKFAESLLEVISGTIQ
ncbi:Lysophospholipase L1 [Pseudobutyrivibrio sp. UC1225]|uniref:GDSL-type esterase/lipase family protein n=1 Tax=Pseudobutyrivibrio sp. UC1225 TaxID=1798185 RepID=UPI0008E0C2ED|nr:GDSL-type esterase/lipase family protein [Pseudobutyrivibrio sp. UC1225]SFN98270.1 Lysophospholipase L1 [Pseudobutyrivibrio sp. UC1225]